MGLIVNAFWRAAMYCLHPRVIALSFLPLLLMVALSFGVGYFFWEASVAWVTDWLQTNELVSTALGWLDSVGAGSLRGVIGPLIVLTLATPVVVMISLLLVALMMTPAMVSLVAERRFPALERKHGASWLGSVFWSLLSTVMAMLAMLASLPLWLIPPLVMVLPPLIWGWLTYRVFAYDALADHASAEERKRLFALHRHQFLVVGFCPVTWGHCPACCGLPGPCSLPWPRYSCHWPFGSTRWCLLFHRCGLPTSHWRRWRKTGRKRQFCRHSQGAGPH